MSHLLAEGDMERRGLISSLLTEGDILHERVEHVANVLEQPEMRRL